LKFGAESDDKIRAHKKIVSQARLEPADPVDWLDSTRNWATGWVRASKFSVVLMFPLCRICIVLAYPV